MTEVVTGTLENWYIVGNVVYGDIYGDIRLRFCDGTPIRTSYIENLSKGEVTTRNSVYKLGKPLSI